VAVTYCRQKRERGKRRRIVAKGKSERDGIVREGRKGLKLGSSGGFCLMLLLMMMMTMVLWLCFMGLAW